MDIDKLEAGRELDALVAEKVMGWRKDDAGNLLPSGYIFTPWAALVNSGAPPYSTDIAAAWGVWLALLQKSHRKREFMWRFFENGEVRIECFEGDKEYMWELESGCGDWQVEGLVPLAICRAALKAVMAEGSGGAR